MIRQKTILALLICVLLGACSPYRFFYYPNNVLYKDPETMGLSYDMATFPSKNGKNIFALIFNTPQHPVKGTILHFHGNYGNVSNHFMQSVFLINHGFDVIVLDYQGYGGSQGKPTPRRTIEDGLAAVDFALKRARDDDKNVALFGQSLGAAVAAVVGAKDKRVQAVILEAGFSSYRTMARHVIGKNIILWIIYPVYPLMLGTAVDPVKHIARISPRPVLILHGDKDNIVPVSMSHILFDKAAEPKTRIIVEGAGHLGLRKMGKDNYETAVADFFKSAFSKKNTP